MDEDFINQLDEPGVWCWIEESFFPNTWNNSEPVVPHTVCPNCGSSNIIQAKVVNNV